MSVKFSWSIIVLLCLFVFSWSLYRDIYAEKQYAGDLRNRVVGARMQKDGLSPYFYKWKKGDGVRYYDPNNFDAAQVANITASPFFHHLLYPIAELPQHSISICWLAAEYAMLLIMAMLGLSLAKTTQQQWLVLIAACLFLLTEAWKMHIANGQNYVCIPFFAMAFYCSIRKKQSLLMAFISGSIAIALVLIKPNAVLFFLPFLFLLKTFSKKYLLVFALPAVIAGLWILTSSHERFLWKQYKENIAQQVKIHQQEETVAQKNEPDPAFVVWEGIDHNEIERQAHLHPLHIFSENGNVFVAVRILLHKRINKETLFVTSCCAMFLLLACFYLRHRVTGFSLPDIALAGFCLFILSDLFSPVYRHQYYGVQWIFPVFLSAALYKHKAKNIYVLISAGILLNIVNINFMPMEHSIGEYIMLLGFIVLSLRRETETSQ